MLFFSNPQSNTDLDTECDKIFHPEKFGSRSASSASFAATLNQGDSAPNVDEGARFYSSANVPQSAGIAENSGRNGGTPFFQRSSSLVEPPVTGMLLV